LKLLSRRPAVERRLGDVHQQVRYRLEQERRSQEMDQLVEELGRKTPVEINDQEVQKLVR
jgi:hypothetical protein